MEFHEKLQGLRKRKGLTQEELAQALYVSRAAISKWEAGRGYPGIDSLKALAGYFSVTIDDLLSGGEMLTIAEEDSKQKVAHTRDMVFGLLDCSSSMLLFLPFFGERGSGTVNEVSLLSLTTAAPYMKAAYVAVVAGMIVWGILTLAMQSVQRPFWDRSKYTLSILLSLAGAILFIVSLQPYAAVLVLVFLMMKVFLLIKKR